MNNLPALLLDDRNSEVALSPQFLQKLETKEDYENAFSVVASQKNTMLWWEADLILDYYKRFHQENLNVYRAGQLMNNSTIKYYLRTASAFPPEKRIPSISFSHHYQATFADEWDSKTLNFSGERRFQYVDQAANNELSTRKLKEVMEIDDLKRAHKTEALKCSRCLTRNNVSLYTIYKSGLPKLDPVRLFYCPRCFDEIMEVLIK